MSISLEKIIFPNLTCFQNVCIRSLFFVGILTYSVTKHRFFAIPIRMCKWFLAISTNCFSSFLFLRRIITFCTAKNNFINRYFERCIAKFTFFIYNWKLVSTRALIGTKSTFSSIGFKRALTLFTYFNHSIPLSWSVYPNQYTQLTQEVNYA